MRFHHQFVTLILVLAVFGDVGNFINSVWTGQELISTNSALILPGAEAVWGHVAKAVVRGVAKSMTKKGKKNGGSEHTKNQRPSTKGKHEKGQSRQQNDQNRASGKKQKGGKDGSKKRGNK